MGTIVHFLILGVLLVLSIAGTILRGYIRNKQTEAGEKYRRELLGMFGMKTREDLYAEKEAQEEARYREKAAEAMSRFQEQQSGRGDRGDRDA